MSDRECCPTCGQPIKKRKGAALPADWVPTAGDIAYCRDLGLTDTQIRAGFEDMRLWAGANSNRAIARKADWSLTFKGWMRRISGQSAGRPLTGVARIPAKSYMEIADDLRTQTNGQRPEPGDLFSGPESMLGGPRHY